LRGAQFQRTRKIIATARRDDQYWKLKSHQRREMTMDSSVSAEYYDSVGVTRVRREALLPLGSRIGLKWL
jgi:hypothetical protein